MVVLKAGIVRLFVSLYSTKMRDEYLSFQAQYLRRVRIPYWSDVSPDFRKELERDSNEDDLRMAQDIVSELYGLSTREATLLQGSVAP